MANFKQCKIVVNGEKEIAVESGKSLRENLADNKILVPSACGGRGICGLCKLKIIDGSKAATPSEIRLLTKDELENDVRLSCQIIVENDMSIEMPAELFESNKYVVECSDIVSLTNDVKLFRFKLVEPNAMDFLPGQYVQLQSPVYEKGAESVYRAYSMANDPNDKNHIELIIKRAPAGICTTFCFDYLKIGQKLTIDGPYGEFGLSGTNAPAIFIAGGSGMSPFRCLLNHLKNTGSKRKVEFYFGGNTEDDLMLTDEMEKFEKALPNFRYVPVVLEPKGNWGGEVGLVTDAVARNIKDASQYEGYLCGSPGMINASVKVLMGLGVPKEKIYYDKF